MELAASAEVRESKRQAESDDPEDALGSQSTSAKRPKSEAKAEDSSKGDLTGEAELPGQVETTAEDLLYDIANIFNPLPVNRRAFAAYQDFPSAPNPCLDVAGVGGIGLPISLRDAAAFRDCAHNSPNTAEVKPESPTLESAPGRWELPASSVKFDNPKFAEFIKKDLRSTACELLSASADTTDIVLERIVLHAPSSDPSNFFSLEERQPLSYAHLALSLIGRWSGGTLGASLGPEKVDLPVSDADASGPRTSASVWHCDTTHTLSPLTGGHRLTLLFSLLHNSSFAPFPAVLDVTSQQLSLEVTLADWLAAPNALQKAAIILKNPTSVTFATLRNAADELKVGILRRAAKERGFDIFLAEVTISQSGKGTDCSCLKDVNTRNSNREDRRAEKEVYDAQEHYGNFSRYTRRRSCCGYAEDEDEDEEVKSVSEDEYVDEVCKCDKNFTEPEGLITTASADTLSGEDGAHHQIAKLPMKVCELVGFSLDEEPDDKQFDWETNILSSTWSRQALVLWPANSTVQILLSARTAIHLCDSLESSISHLRTASALEQASERGRAAETALALCESEDAQVANAKLWGTTVLRAAILLQDTRVFDKLVQAVKGRTTPSSLDSSIIAESVATFGESRVVQLLVEMLKPHSDLQIRLQVHHGHGVPPTTSLADRTTILQAILSANPTLVAHSGSLYASIMRTNNLDSSEAIDVVAMLKILGTEVFEQEISPLVKTQEAEDFILRLVRLLLASPKDDGVDGALCRSQATKFLSHAIDLFEASPTSIGFKERGRWDTSPTFTFRDANVWTLFILVLDDGANPLLLGKLYVHLQHPIPSLPSQSAYFSSGLRGLVGEMIKEFELRGLSAAVRTNDAFNTFYTFVTEAFFTADFDKWSSGTIGPQTITAAVESLRLAILTKSHERLTRVGDVISTTNLFNVAVPFCKKVALKAQENNLLSTEPWAEPLRSLVAATLSKVLAYVGPRETFKTDITVPKVGCGCAECAKLDAFLQDDRLTLSVKDLMEVRNHLTKQLRHKNLELTMETLKNDKRHTLILTKSLNWQIKCNWDARKEFASSFEQLLREVNLLTKFGIS